MALPVKKLLTDFDVEQNQKLFNSVQGYTLVPHGREHVWLALLQFDCTEKSAEQKQKFVGLLSTYGAKANSAYELYKSYRDHQVEKVRANTKVEKPEGTVVAVGLAWPAYGDEKGKLFPSGEPNSPSFKAGFMKKLEEFLKVKPPATSRYSAVIIIANKNPENLETEKRALDNDFSELAEISWEKGGVSKTDHFGYTEGISQPVFFDCEPHRTADWTSDWDPAVGLGCVLTSQPDRRDEAEYGSFMAYLKLKQEVDDFNQVVWQTARELTAQSTGGEALKEASEKVMAQLLGRKPDGEPLISPARADHNDFDFSADPEFSRCPFHAHIRKVNPRTEHSRNKRILRRGALYRYKEEVGTLFQCFQSDLSTGFEYIFGRWALDKDFPREKAGRDALLWSSVSVGSLVAEIAQKRDSTPQMMEVCEPAKRVMQAAAAGEQMSPQSVVKAPPPQPPAQKSSADDIKDVLMIQEEPTSEPLTYKPLAPGSSLPAAEPSQSISPTDPKRFIRIRDGEYFYFPSIPFFRRLAPPPTGSE